MRVKRSRPGARLLGRLVDVMPCLGLGAKQAHPRLVADVEDWVVVANRVQHSLRLFEPAGIAGLKVRLDVALARFFFPKEERHDTGGVATQPFWADVLDSAFERGQLVHHAVLIRRVCDQHSADGDHAAPGQPFPDSNSASSDAVNLDCSRTSVLGRVLGTIHHYVDGFGYVKMRGYGEESMQLFGHVPLQASAD